MRLGGYYGVDSTDQLDALAETLDTHGLSAIGMPRGDLTDDELDTFGGYGVIHIPNFQGLLHHICENGFEHHVAINLSQCAAAVNEALSHYLGWDVYFHK